MTDIAEKTAEQVEETVEGTAEQLATLCDRRAQTYRLLARMYRIEADQQLIDELKAMRFPAKTGNESTTRGYRLLSKYLARPADGMLLELAVDYVRTFMGGGGDGHAAAYPFESVYTSEKRLLMQDARDEVLAIYRSEGLNKSLEWKDSEDHLALELEFVQILCERASEAFRAGDEAKGEEYLRAQRGFINGHLLNWVGSMFGDMMHFSKTDFYRGLACLTEGVLDTDIEFLDELLGEEADGTEEVAEAEAAEEAGDVSEAEGE